MAASERPLDQRRTGEIDETNDTRLHVLPERTECPFNPGS